MRFIRLREYQTTRAVELMPSEVTALQRATTSVAIAVSLAEEGCYDLTPSSWVGVVNLESLTIEIRPKIAIDRLLFLLSYSLDPKQWRDQPFDYEEKTSIVEAIIPGFVHQVHRALRQGVLQGYRTQEEALSTVRGRIRFSDQLRHHFGIAPPIEVQYDEFTEDIIENQLIKAALNRLARLRIRSANARYMLHQFDAVLERVSHVEFHRQQLPIIHYTRLNQRYQPALELAKLIIRSTSYDLGKGHIAASTFLVDMNKIFEDFVVTALRESLGLSPAAFPQGATRQPLHLDQQHRLRLKPDISWWSTGKCVFVGDVKYKRLANPGYQHADIYQLLAYTVATDLPGGLLLYAKGEDVPITHHVNHLGKTLHVVTLDLDQPPEQILEQIDEVADRIRQLRHSSHSATYPTHLAV